MGKIWVGDWENYFETRGELDLKSPDSEMVRSISGEYAFVVGSVPGRGTIRTNRAQGLNVMFGLNSVTAVTGLSAGLAFRADCTYGGAYENAHGNQTFHLNVHSRVARLKISCPECWSDLKFNEHYLCDNCGGMFDEDTIQLKDFLPSKEISLTFTL